MNLRLLIASGLAALAAFTAQASITLDIQGDLVASSLGNTTGVPDPSVVFIVVDTTGNGFATPTAGIFSANGLWGGSTDDYVVFSFAANGTGSSGTPGAFEEVNGGLNLSDIPGWTAGDHLEMYWFSTENFGNGGGSATILQPGDGYGSYGFASIGGNSTQWITPPNTGLQGMVFLNPQGSVFGPGSDLGTFGSIAPVPETSTFALLGGVSALGYSLYRRRGRTV